MPYHKADEPVAGKDRHDSNEREREADPEHHSEREGKSCLRHPSAEGEEHREQGQRARDQSRDNAHHHTFTAVLMNTITRSDGAEDQPQTNSQEHAPAEMFEGECTACGAEGSKHKRSSDERQQHSRTDMRQREHSSDDKAAQSRQS